MKDEPWRGDPAARCLHLEKKLHNQAEEITRLAEDARAWQDNTEALEICAKITLHGRRELEDRLDRALALLRTLEWSRKVEIQGQVIGECCPVCDGVSDKNDNPEFGKPFPDNGHRDDCALAALLEEKDGS